MPETYIEDFTDAGNILPTDLMNIQRKEAGLWTNYAIPTGLINDMYTLDTTVDIADVQGGGVTVLGAPAAGTMNLIIDGYMQYIPGAVFDGSLFDVELNDTASNVVTVASFNFSPFDSASILTHNPVQFTPVTSVLSMATITPTAADGQIRLFLQYVNVFI